MALIQVTEASLRPHVPEPVFAQALSLADQGRVTALSVNGARLAAKADGHAVAVRITPGGIEATCACEEPAPCHHAVATALAWVRTGEKRPLPDLYAVLCTRNADWLARRLTQLAENDPALADRLLAEAEETTAADALADLRAELEEVMADLLAEAEEHNDDWHIDEWYPDTTALNELLDELDDLIEETPDAAREVIDRAIDLIEQAMDTERVYGGELLDILSRVQSMHLDACLTGSPDPERLAEQLIGTALASQWCTFERSLPDYAPALGDQGLIRCRELLERGGGREHSDYSLRTLWESLARAEGGTDAVVDLLAQRASSSHDIAHIAQILIAGDRFDDALTWIDKGLRDYRPDHRLLSLALDCQLRTGRAEMALETRWQLFALSPGLPAYQHLIRQAGPEAATWSARAIAHLRSIQNLAAPLTEVLLLEGNVADAWEIVEARKLNLGHDLRMQVVNARAQSHPQDAIPIYRELAESSVSRGSKPGYQEAIRYLITARTLAERAGGQDDFAAYITRLRAAHPGKKVFQQELDRVDLP